MQIASRITDATVSGGTGALTLLGTALPGTRSVLSAYTAGTGELPLMIVDAVTGAWEHSYCTLGAGGVITRDVQIETSAGTIAPIAFAAGTTKQVYLDTPITLFDRTIPYSNSIPLDGKYDMGIHVVTAPIAFAPIALNHRRGSLCKLTLVADGSSAITFPGFNVTGTYATTTGSVNDLTFTFNGIGAAVTISSTAAVIPTPGTLQFSAGTYSVGEGGGSIAITVTRTGGSSGAASVGYATSSGTATSGADFTATSGTLNWADGDAASKTFNVPILQDVLVEGAETFNLTLSSATGAALGSPSTAVVTIVDDDFAATITGTAPGGTVGVAYSYQFATTGFVGTITPTYSSALPAGLSLSVSGTNIVLSGSPTTAATSTFTISATGATSGSASSSAQSVTIVAGASTTRARTVAAAAQPSDLLALLNSMTVLGGSPTNDRSGSVATTLSPTFYQWVAVTAAAFASGLTFTDSQNATGGWSGALSSSVYLGPEQALTTNHLSVTDGNGVVWNLVRTSGHANGTTFTLS